MLEVAFAVGVDRVIVVQVGDAHEVIDELDEVEKHLTDGRVDNVVDVCDGPASVEVVVLVKNIDDRVADLCQVDQVDIHLEMLQGASACASQIVIVWKLLFDFVKGQKTSSLMHENSDDKIGLLLYHSHSELRIEADVDLRMIFSLG